MTGGFGYTGGRHATFSERPQVFGRLRFLEVLDCPFINLPEKHRSRWGEGLTAGTHEQANSRAPRELAYPCQLSTRRRVLSRDYVRHAMVHYQVSPPGEVEWTTSVCELNDAEQMSVAVKIMLLRHALSNECSEESPLTPEK